MIEKNLPSKTKPLKSYYFQTLSGLVTTIQAENKDIAKRQYIDSFVLPIPQYAPRVISFGCCAIVEVNDCCSRRYCPIPHFYSSDDPSISSVLYVPLLNHILTTYPNTSFLSRLKILMDTRPSISHEGYRIYQKNPDGTELQADPTITTFSWEEANIVVRVTYSKSYKPENYPSTVMYSIYPILFQKINTYSICYEVLYNLLDKLTPELIDKLSGSLEPSLVEPPVRAQPPPEEPVAIEPPSSSSLNPLRNRKNMYQRIEIEKVENW